MPRESMGRKMNSLKSFKSLIEDQNKEDINFRNNLKMLYFALESILIIPDKIKFCSFRNVLEDYANKTIHGRLEPNEQNHER